MRVCAALLSRRLSGCRVMGASLVYLLLRQVLQTLTQLARDDGAKDLELLVLRHQVSSLHLPKISSAHVTPRARTREGCRRGGCLRTLRWASMS